MKKLNEKRASLATPRLAVLILCPLGLTLLAGCADLPDYYQRAYDAVPSCPDDGLVAYEDRVRRLDSNEGMGTLHGLRDKGWTDIRTHHIDQFGDHAFLVSADCPGAAA